MSGLLRGTPALTAGNTERPVGIAGSTFDGQATPLSRTPGVAAVPRILHDEVVDKDDYADVGRPKAPVEPGLDPPLLRCVEELAYFRDRSLRNPRWLSIKGTKFRLGVHLHSLENEPNNPLAPLIAAATKLNKGGPSDWEQLPAAVDAIVVEAERLLGRRIRGRP